MAWLEGTRIGVRYYSPTEAPPIIYSNSVNGDDPNCPPNQWNNAVVPSISDDPANGIPDDCIAVFLSGILIITGGNTPTDEAADIHVRFRRWLAGNNQYLPAYAAQAVAETNNGARNPYTQIVPVDCRRFQFYWTRSTPPPYPVHASYGFNAWVSGYVRP